MQGDSADDKVKLRSCVLKVLSGLRKRGNNDRKLEADLPAQLRVKIERSLTWKSVR